jgi:phosphopantetheinyl transferase (holo-ACP synthase)
MFHGPAFQGIVDLGPLGQDGITGTIETGRAPGALLDNAGQLLGYWFMASFHVDSLAMPVRVERIEFYEPEPPAGTRVLCNVRIRDLNPVSVRADMELTVAGRLIAKVTGWEDRRLQTDDRLWPVLRDPEKNLLAVVQPEGYAYFRDIYRQTASQDFLARRFLSEAEREVYLSIGPQGQRQWLAGRVAAKDAVRAWLWNHGSGPIYPAEVEILSDANGLPQVRGSFAADLHVAIANKDDIAVAVVSEGSPAHVDIERICAGFAHDFDLACDRPPAASRPSPSMRGTVTSAKSAGNSPP